MQKWGIFIILVIVVGVGAVKLDRKSPNFIEVGHGIKSNKTDTPLVLNCSVNYSRPTNPASVRVNWTRGVYVNRKLEHPYPALPAEQITMILGNNMINSTYTSAKKRSHLEAGDYVCEFFEGVKLLNKTHFTVVTAPYPSTSGYIPLKEHNHQYYRKIESIVQKTDDSAKLTCESKAFPEWNVTWFRITDKSENDAKLIEAGTLGKPEPITNTDNSQNIWIENSTILHIKKLTFDHRGYYLCISDNSVEPPLYLFTLIRVKDRLAPLWPVLALIGEVILLVLIIVICDFFSKKAMKNEDEAAGVVAKNPARPTNAAASAPPPPDADVKKGCEVRQRPAASPAKGGT